MAKRAFKIGVMGSAAGSHQEEILEKAKALGRAIAENSCILVYGATIGVPLAAAEACKEAGGTVIGVSPAKNEKEHVEEYKMPVDSCSSVIYTGFGLTGRNVVLVRSCDAAIIVSGRVGTLIEFAAAYAEEKLTGVLTGTGGVADKAKELEEMFAKKYDTKIIYESSPGKLVEKVVAELGKQKH